MRYVQEVYGTRITFTLFSHNMSNLFKGGVCPFENKAEDIPAAAKALSDSIFKYGYDGIDFDHECSGSDLFYNKDNMTMLLREMRKKFRSGQINYGRWKYSSHHGRGMDVCRLCDFSGIHDPQTCHFANPV